MVRPSRSRIPAEFFLDAQRDQVTIPRAYRAALRLWLRWNEAYELATAQLFSSGQSAETLELYMDTMDRLRRDAVSQSHELLD
jgi:hypothetical protein